MAKNAPISVKSAPQRRPPDAGLKPVTKPATITLAQAHKAVRTYYDQAYKK